MSMTSKHRSSAQALCEGNARDDFTQFYVNLGRIGVLLFSKQNGFKTIVFTHFISFLDIASNSWLLLVTPLSVLFLFTLPTRKVRPLGKFNIAGNNCSHERTPPIRTIANHINVWDIPLQTKHCRLHSCFTALPYTASSVVTIFM
jgi:hypothetical protein